MSNSKTPRLNIRKAFHLDESPRYSEERLSKKYKRLTHQVDDRFERLSDEMDDHFEDFAYVQVKRFEHMEARIDALTRKVFEQSKLKSSDTPVAPISKCSDVVGKKEDSSYDKERFKRMEDRIDDVTPHLYDENNLNSLNQPITSDDEEEEEDTSDEKVNLPHERPELLEEQPDNLTEKGDKKSDPTESYDDDDDDDDDEDYIEEVYPSHERLKPTEDQPDDLTDQVGKQSNPISLDDNEEEKGEDTSSDDKVLLKRKEDHPDAHNTLAKNDEGQSKLRSFDQSTESKVKGSIKRIKNEDDWNNNFEKLRQHKIMHNHCVPTQISKEDPKLGKWAQRQSYRWNNLIRGGTEKISPERLIKLDSIGMKWSKKYGPPPSWDQMYEKVRGFHQAEGHCNVPLDDSTDPIPLATWLAFNRTQYKNRPFCLITQEQIEKLDGIDFDWEGAKL
eukprot:CAMPEP_0116089158 /NCGR_PEP_ID=MMETSP0327-20121206/6280_1 /TAXON_ID=44447 /ORGANISM="Pseudo-nitzschia delicatissima, Strain B596" /LENGTH=446 /DNA_ID=CAMNT_0003580339 /DNA_START=122 /DNA_END=1462 /DNA_ORIENTATION=-